MPPCMQALLLNAVTAGAAASAAAIAGSGAAVPSAVQLMMLRAGGLAQFMHFSVDPFTSIEHNCVGTSGECVPASAFNPTDLDTDQWWLYPPLSLIIDGVVERIPTRQLLRVPR